jgi:transcriptional regulator of acetoin/glycerol metabolism
MMINPRYIKGSTRYQRYVQQGAIAAITNALMATDGNVTYAAKRLGLQRTYLIRLMRSLGIPRLAHRPVMVGTTGYGGYHTQTEAAAKSALVHALTVSSGNRTRAARMLGISRVRVQVLMRRWKLTKRFPFQRGGDFR